jgi:hypothetical protein
LGGVLLALSTFVELYPYPNLENDLKRIALIFDNFSYKHHSLFGLEKPISSAVDGEALAINDLREFDFDGLENRLPSAHETLNFLTESGVATTSKFDIGLAASKAETLRNILGSGPIN